MFFFNHESVYRHKVLLKNKYSAHTLTRNRRHLIVTSRIETFSIAFRSRHSPLSMGSKCVTICITYRAAWHSSIWSTSTQAPIILPIRAINTIRWFYSISPGISSLTDMRSLFAISAWITNDSCRFLKYVISYSCFGRNGGLARRIQTAVEDRLD